MNLATQLTTLRIVLIPLLIVFFYWQTPWAGYTVVALFILAALTDWFDGYVARRLRQTTGFGAFLDPIADKLIVAVTLVLIVEQADSWPVTIAALIVIGREITVSGLREWMAKQGRHEILQVTRLAKIKTVVQMTAIVFLLLGQKTNLSLWEVDFFAFGLVLLYLAVFFTIVSMLVYIFFISKNKSFP